MNSLRKAGPLQGFTLLSCITLAVMGALLIAPIIPQMLVAFKDTPNVEYWVPMIVTVPALCVAFFSPIAGWLGDRFGRRKLLIPAMLIYSICGLAPLFLDDLTYILISRVGVGLTEAVVMTLSTTMIGDLFDNKSRDKWLAGQTAVASASAVIFLAIGGYAGRFGWQGPFIVYAFPLILMVALILFTWETGTKNDGHHIEPPHFFSHEPGSADISTATQAAKKSFPYGFMLGVCVITLFASLMFYSVQIQLSAGLSSLGVKDPAVIGLLTAIASLAVPVGTFVFWGVSKRFSIPTLLLIEFFIMGIAYIGMSKMTDVKYFVACAALSQIGAGMILPTLLTWAMSRLEFSVRGIGTGIWQSTFSFGQFACGIVVTFLSLNYGGIIAAFGLLGMGSLVAAALALVGRLFTPKTQAQV